MMSDIEPSPPEGCNTTIIKDQQEQSPKEKNEENLRKKQQHYVSLDSFSWCEEPYYVKIYVDFEQADQISDNQIKFTSTIDTLELIVEHETKTYRFEIDALFDRIESATLKKKKNKFIITLKKLKERIWYKIRY